MSERNFRHLLQKQWDKGHFVCVGLDSDFEKIPKSYHRPGNERDMGVANTIVAFNLAIVEQTCDLVCAYKPNIAFYEAHGDEGLQALWRTIAEIHFLAPDVPVILDAKRGDIGNSNKGYVTGSFNWLQADAVTISPYLGQEALQPFLDQKDKGIFVLCHTSNSGAGEFQDLPVGDDGEKLCSYVARQVSKKWNTNKNCGLVVGATYPREIEQIRNVVSDDITFLIPGIGKQGGDLQSSVTAGKNRWGQGFIVNNSSGVIFATDPRRQVLWMNEDIESCR